MQSRSSYQSQLRRLAELHELVNALRLVYTRLHISIVGRSLEQHTAAFRAELTRYARKRYPKLEPHVALGRAMDDVLVAVNQMELFKEV